MMFSNVTILKNRGFAHSLHAQTIFLIKRPIHYNNFMELVDKKGIYVVDAEYFQAELAAIHLVRSKDRLAIIDSGTQHSVKNVSLALETLELNYSNVDYIILTHIHLDHAGGASALMDLCPNAKLVVHPRGARHMADPTKLIAGSKAVYGETQFKRLYGEIRPIDEARIIETSDGFKLDFGQRELAFIDTPGHASHHHCIYDKHSESMFTGDTLGVCYRALRNKDHSFILPTTTPVQFNPDALHESIDKVMAFAPKTLYLTHYSKVTPTARMIAGLHEQIDDLVMLTEQAFENSDTAEKKLKQSVEDYLVNRCCNELKDLSEDVARQWLTLDAQLNAQGLAFWWQHKRTA